MTQAERETMQATLALLTLKTCHAIRLLDMNTTKKTAPLRQIVEVLRPALDTYGTQRVRLGCGHEATASAGAIYRARCLRCRMIATPPTPCKGGA